MAERSAATLQPARPVTVGVGLHERGRTPTERPVTLQPEVGATGELRLAFLLDLQWRGRRFESMEGMCAAGIWVCELCWQKNT